MATWTDIQIAMRKNQTEMVKTYTYLTTRQGVEGLWISEGPDDPESHGRKLLDVERVSHMTSGMQIILSPYADHPEKEVLFFPYNRVLSSIPEM
jgi:hypothetical protein